MMIFIYNYWKFIEIIKNYQNYQNYQYSSKLSIFIKNIKIINIYQNYQYSFISGNSTNFGLSSLSKYQ